MARRCKCGCRVEMAPASKCTTMLSKMGFASVECQERVALINLDKIRKKNAAQLKKQAKEKTLLEKKKRVEFKKKVKLSDVKVRKNAAKAACHKYIRERDRGDPCICCGRPLGEKFDAGHFLESGNNPKLRYHEDNIHAQSVYCNQYQGGNSDDYEGRLRIKIGNDRVDYLLSNKGASQKRTVEDYLAIEKYYKEKLSALPAK